MTYTNWEQGQPDQDGGKDEDCLEVYLANGSYKDVRTVNLGKWNDYNCTSKRSAAACQKWAFGAVIPSVAATAAHNGR
ncbi:unnamed protein product, partial [Mesorhabditis spiculigera]